MKKFLLLFLLFSLFFASAFAVIEHEEMKLFAVTTAGDAVSAGLFVTIEPGTGKVWTDVVPLVGTTTQSAEKTAVEVAGKYFPDSKSYDYKFDIESNASIVEGPSAGAAMALIVVKMLRDEPLNDKVSITGTITESGRVGQVGGVYEKTKQAAKEGIKLFLIPKGEARQMVREDDQVKTVNLISYAFSEWGMKVVEVADLDEVLLLSSTNIEELDINAADITEIKEFSPPPIQFYPNLAPMQDITYNMLQESQVSLSEAKNSLSSTFISDEVVIDYLLQTLNSAERALKEAQIQFDNNYLYSAANSSFIASVYISLVKDIADNPSLLQEGSRAFELKVENLGKEIDSLKAGLEEFVPIDFLEWHIAAKQRLSWAELNLEELTSVHTIVIGSSGSVEDTASVLAKMEDLEFAIAWIKAADSFYQKTRASKKRVLMDERFKDYFKDYIVNAQNSMAAFPEEEVEDIQRRLNSALLGEENGWFLPASFDAASSYALVNAMVKLNGIGDDMDELHSLLEEKVSLLQAEIAESGEEFVWAQLYLDHATYFLNAAEFYESEGYSVRALENLKSGVSLAFLASEMFNVSKDVKQYYSGFGPQDFLNPTAGSGGLVQQEMLETVYFALLLCLLTILVLVIAVLAKTLARDYRFQHFSLQEQINQMHKLKQRIDQEFLEGRISREKHLDLSGKFLEQIRFLKKEIEENSQELMEMDRIKADLCAYDKRLRDLKKHYREGKIIEGDFRQRVQEYHSRINALNSLLSTELSKQKRDDLNTIKKTLALTEQQKLAVKKEKTEKKQVKGASKPKPLAVKGTIAPKSKVKGTSPPKGKVKGT